jgi:magnesium chelatase subunit I
VSDLPATVAAVQGKVEFESSEEGREAEVLEHLLRRAVADTFRARLGGVDLSGLTAKFAEGVTVETGELVPAGDLLAALGPVPGLAKLLAALGIDEGAETPGLAAAGLEFALEGLWLLRRLSKDWVADRAVYGSR